jgi:D-beta-D-heptose 7-phosphate kinase/D-beta-D-heptose 1-phosphate adenosyltransferase
MQVVTISDYGKGFLTPSLIAKIIRMAKLARVPVVVDPKGLDFTKYRGATVLKPNAQEAYAAAGLSPSAPLDQVARRLSELSQVDLLLITRSEAGMSLYDTALTRQDFPVRTREVKDVTGAGDSVLAVISVGLANGLEISIAAELANIAAGIAIERLGCVQVSLSQLAERLLEVDSESKVFDDSQTFALRQVLKDKTYSLLALSHGQKMSNGLFRALKRLKKDKEEELIVYVRGGEPEEEFVQFLSSLQEVDYIILHAKNLKTLSEEIHPREVYLLEDERLKHVEGRQTILEHLLLMTR